MGDNGDGMLKLLKADLLEDFQKEIDMETFVNKCDFKSVELSYAFECSSVFSSNIEGNSMDLNSYMNQKHFKSASNKELEEINDLVQAYEGAKKSPLNEKNLLLMHKLISKRLLIKSKQGLYREEKVGVYSPRGLVYLAIEPEFVGEKMSELFEDIDSLLEQKLSLYEAFYFSSMIHLVFVHIHPFSDGNGRVARLLEKWFLSEILGEEFWKIQSEYYYKKNQSLYYENINLGVNYYELEYRDALPFLKMLPQSLDMEQE